MTKQVTIRRAGATLALVGVLMALAVPAYAAPPPAGYRTDQVMAEVQNSSLGKILIRRGFWDDDAGKGFGMDKAWHYHNLPSLTAQKYVMGSTDHTLQSNNTWRLRASAYKEECTTSGGRKTCKVVDEREVWGIYQPKSFDTYRDWPVGGKLGLLTMYCKQGGAIKCPSWVVIALRNAAAGTSTASRAASGTTEASPAPTIEQGLTPMQQKSQQELYDSQEVKSLLKQVESGEVVLGASYKKRS